MNIRKKIRIAVFGGRDAAPDLLHEAELLGRGIAERDWLLLCGGRGGIMEAVSKGCRDAAGIAVGILPGTDDSDANPYLEMAIPTGIGFARNSLLATACHAAVAIGGKYGTLSEIAYALQYEKPLITLRSWDIPGCIEVENAAAALRELDRILAGKE
jgi:uncharacterized protein (TIGR00725 family)